MLFTIAFATVWGATIVPLVMLVSLAFERLQAARRLARLDPDAPYETRLQAEHEARQSRNVPTRHIEWCDFASPRAVVPATLATLLALTPPLVEGWSDVGLLIGVIGSITWWSHLQRSGVRYAATYASAVWCVPAIVWVAVMLATSGAYPAGNDYPWQYVIWQRAVTDPVVPAVLLAWALILIRLAIFCSLRRRFGRFAIVLTATAVIPLATVVVAGSLLGTAQAALAVVMIGYIMSKSGRRLSDAAAARTKADASARGETESVITGPQLNRGDVILGAALVMASVTATNVLQVFADISLFEGGWPLFADISFIEGGWPLRVALFAGLALLSGLLFMRRGRRDFLIIGAAITVAAIFALSLQTVGSWVLADFDSPGSSVVDLAGQGIIYQQVTVMALGGLLIFAWSAARHRFTGYGAMAIGFAWPLIMTGMLGPQIFKFVVFPLTIQAWIPVSIAAPLVIAAMWFVSCRDWNDAI